MPIKKLWDFIVYFCLAGLFYFLGRCDGWWSLLCLILAGTFTISAFYSLVVEMVIHAKSVQVKKLTPQQIKLELAKRPELRDAAALALIFCSREVSAQTSILIKKTWADFHLTKSGGPGWIEKKPETTNSRCEGCE